MARSKEYFINKLKSGYRVEMIFQQRDLDEMEAVVIQDHIREGHQLSEKEDYGTLREVLRMFMAENIDRKQRENGPVITTATQAIEAIDPKLVPQSIKSTVDFAAQISSNLINMKNIGDEFPNVAIDVLTGICKRKLEKEGRVITKIDESNLRDANNLMWGPMMTFFGKTIGSL